MEEAIRCYEKVIEVNPQDAVSIRNLGTCFITINQMEKAIKYFEKALSLNPEDALSYNGIGSALISLNKTK